MRVIVEAEEKGHAGGCAPQRGWTPDQRPSEPRINNDRRAEEPRLTHQECAGGQTAAGGAFVDDVAEAVTGERGQRVDGSAAHVRIRFRLVVRWLGAGRLGEILFRPLVTDGGQRTFLAGDALERDAIDRHLVEPRIEALGPHPFRVAVFRHETVEETRLGRWVALNRDRAEGDDAGIAHRRVAFELAIGIDRTHFGGFERDARIALDVALEMAGGTGVDVDLASFIDEQVGDHVGLAGGVDRANMAKRYPAEKRLGFGATHLLVLAADDALAHAPLFTSRRARDTSDRRRPDLRSAGCAAASRARRAYRCRAACAACRRASRYRSGTCPCSRRRGRWRARARRWSGPPPSRH